MAQIKITKAFLAKAKPTDKDQYFWDSSISGFGARVYPKGTIKLVFKYVSPITKKKVSMTLATFHSSIFDEMKAKALAFRTLVDSGKDPKLELEKKVNSEAQGYQQSIICTLNALLDKHLELAETENSENTYTDKQAIFNNHIRDELGQRPAQDISEEDVRGLIFKIKANKSTDKVSYERTCNKLISYLSKAYEDVIKLKGEWSHIVENPVRHIKVTRSKAREVYLNKSETQSLLDICEGVIAKDLEIYEQYDSTKKRKLRLNTYTHVLGMMLLTDTSWHEVVFALRSEIQTSKKKWIIPVRNLSTINARTINLSEEAAAFVKRAMALHSLEYAFANCFTNKRLKAKSVDIRKAYNNLLSEAKITTELDYVDIHKLSLSDKAKALEVVYSKLNKDEVKVASFDPNNIKSLSDINHYAWITVLTLMTGARSVEIRHAHKDQIDLNESTWTIPKEYTKGSLARKIPLNDKAKELFKKLIEIRGNDFLFVNKRTQAPITSFNKGLDSAVVRAGIAKEIHPHDLRRTFGCTLLLAGVDIFTVSKLLGHSSVVVTERHYAFLNINFLQQEIQRLNQVLSL